MQTYLVGGAVRDSLLNIAIKDKDWVVVGSTPAELINLGYSQVGADFPVFLHPKTKEEYALARTERKSGSGYQGFNCDFNPDITLEEDLLRRDLTVNAMAQNDDGSIVDPYNGQRDIKEKKLRHVSDAFSEDPLRVLRVARFAARFAHLGFTIADETIELMRDIANSGELALLTPERVWQETERALGESQPWVYFQALRDCNALAIIFPELDNLFGIPQPEKHHPEIDCGIHTLMVLEQASKLSSDINVRWASLLHDLGKGLTREEILPSHHGHEQSGEKLVIKLNNRLKTPNEFKDLSRLVCVYHTHVHRAFELKPQTLLKFFNNIDLWRKPERLPQILLACKADSRGRTGFEDVEYTQVEYITEVAEACIAVTATQFVAQGIQGKAIGEAIAIKRLDVIKQFAKNKE
ncbi:MAG: multifunctional CCA addition/repair protein [Oleispira antarctica]|nr:multifunctional CCA addition/repair protein [Oleispira antarctica]MBQ0794050.1 multifunctional CCA addition/repair protein [Oleispira antarctica]